MNIDTRSIFFFHYEVENTNVPLCVILLSKTTSIVSMTIGYTEMKSVFLLQEYIGLSSVTFLLK